MKAGRELDALVAEKVMGLPIMDFTKTARQPYFTWGGEYTNIHYALNNEPYVMTGVEKAGCPQVRRIDDYSTSIADAWQVVEKLRKDGLWFLLEYEEPPKCCYASFYAPIRESGEISSRGNVYADTAPLAICKAALKACGVDVESPK